MGNIWEIRLIAALALLLTGCRATHPDAANDLVDAFGSSCVTSGSWTQQALAHSQAIATVIQKIKDTDACKPFQSILGSIQSSSQQIQSLMSDATYANYRTSEESVQDLTLAYRQALAADPNSDLTQSLGQALVSAQVTLAQNQAANYADQAIRKRDGYVAATAQLSTLTQQMLGQADGLSKCLKQSPSVAVEIASNIMAIGGNFASPVFGAFTHVLGELINFGVEYARNNATNEALWKLNEVQMPNALTCGLESMSELYCNAQDSMDLLQLQTNSQIDRPLPGFWRGMDLIARRLPVLDNWLLSVRNGVLPEDPDDAQRQNEVWDKIHFLDDIGRTVHATLFQAKKRYDASIASPQNQQSIMVKAIEDTVGLIQGSGSPFNDLSGSSDTLACWLTIDPNDLPPDQTLSSAPANMCPLHVPNVDDYGGSYIRNHLLPVTSFDKMFANWFGLQKRANDFLDVEFKQTVTGNVNSIMPAAKATPRVDNVSPYEVLKRTQEFLQDQLDNDNGSNPSKPAFVQSVLDLVTQGIAIIDDTTSKPASDRVIDVYQLFKLSQGLQYFDSGIEQLIDWDLGDRLRRGEFPNAPNDILYTSGIDLRSRLSAAGIQNNLDAIEIDLNSARQLTTSNLDIFRNFFAPSFSKSVKYLAHQAEKYDEPKEGVDRPFGQTLGHLCTLIVASGLDWPDSKTREICKGAVLNSIYPDPDGKISIRVGELDEQLKNAPFKQRVCSFHRFLRAGRYASVFSNQGLMGARAPHTGRASYTTPDLLNWMTGVSFESEPHQ